MTIVYLFHDRKNVRLEVIISIGANTDIDLTRISVGFVLSGQMEDRIRSSLRDLLKERDV
jgi:hypothetical protein